MRKPMPAVVLALAIVLAGPAYAVEPASEERVAEVAARGAHVMPFALDRTTHVFEKVATGGVQRVVAKDPADAAQVDAVRAHLREIAAAFARGDFAAPEAIHGAAMPGLAELRSAGRTLAVDYEDLADGGLIRYASDDARIVDALHRWFDAQLSDHAHHAHGG